MNRQLGVSRLFMAGFFLAIGAAACGGGGSSGGSSFVPGPLPATAAPAATPISTTVPVSASQGGTVSLPDGSSVAIPPGLLGADTTVTLSMNPQAAPASVSGLNAASGDLKVSFGSQVLGAFRRPGSAVRASAPGFVKLSLSFPASNRAAIFQSGTLAVRLHQPNGSSIFVVPDMTVDAVSNVVTASLDPALFVGIDLLTLTASTIADLHKQFQPYPEYLDFSTNPPSWNRNGTLLPHKRTLVLVHGILSTASTTYSYQVPRGSTPTGECAARIKTRGNYDQVVGFTYDWTQLPADAGKQLRDFINGLGQDWIDIEAHSYGTVVALQALPDIQVPVKNVVLVGGPLPLRGAPNAATPNFLMELMLNGFTGLQDPPAVFEAGKTGMLHSVQSNSNELVSILIRLPVGAASPQYIEAAGEKPFPGLEQWLSLIAPFHKPYDGVIEEEAALTNAPLNTASKVVKKGFTVDHNHLTCETDVINYVGSSLIYPPPAPVVTPTPTPPVATTTPTPTPPVATTTPTPTPPVATSTPTPPVVTATPTPPPPVVTSTPTPPIATATPLVLSSLTAPDGTTSVSTNTVGYQPTLTASGSGFNSVTSVTFDQNGAASFHKTWIRGDADWNAKVNIANDNSMTLRPVVTQATDGSGSSTWTVTLTNAVTSQQKTFTLSYTAPLTFTNLTTPNGTSSVSTSSAGFQPTLTATGTGFNNVTSVTFDQSGAASFHKTWVRGDADWNAKVNVVNDTSMTLRPVVTQQSDNGGVSTWKVTLSDPVTSQNRSFTLNYVH